MTLDFSRAEPALRLAVLERRLSSELARLNGFRTRLFLDVYWQIHAEWEKLLGEDDSVDFEDVLIRAADHL
jgi:hypothetical protein